MQQFHPLGAIMTFHTQPIILFLFLYNLCAQIDTKKQKPKTPYKPHSSSVSVLPPQLHSLSLLCSALQFSETHSNGRPSYLRLPEPTTTTTSTHFLKTQKKANTVTLNQQFLFTLIPMPLLSSQVLHFPSSRWPPKRSQA